MRLVNMITIEGIKVKARTIPEKQLVSAWKMLSNKPFPKIKVYQLNDEDFDRVIRLRRCEEGMLREMEEWGRILSTRGTDACVLNANEFANLDYIVLIRKNPYHSIQEIIRHELSHIARGDL